MDETTVNSHMRLRKAWSYADKPVNTLIGRKRYGGTTIYGAIGNCLKNPVFMLGESTNIEEFEEFMQKVKLNCKESSDKPYLVIDNHSAHRSNRVKEYLEANFTLLFMPPYSC